MKSPRVLFVRLNDIGEVVMATAAIAAARMKFPEAYLALLVARPSDELVQSDPYLDRVFVCDKRKWRRGQRKAFLTELFPLVRELWRERFDIAIDLHNYASTHWLIRASDAKQRFGLATSELTSYFFTTRIPPHPEWGATHQVERFRYLTEKALGPLPPSQPIVTVSPEVQASMDRRIDTLLINGNQPNGWRKPLICFQPGASIAPRCWPPDRFATIATWLIQDYGVRIVVHAGPGEEGLIEAIRQHEPRVDGFSRLSLQELAALLIRSTLLLSNDTGPMHIAAAVGTPVVGIFGPTNPMVSGPYTEKKVIVTQNIHCSPCGIYAFDCPHHDCLNHLPLDMVQSAIMQLLNHNHGR